VTTAPTTATDAPMTATGPVRTGHLLLDPGMDLTLRPMRYPEFYDRFRDAIKNTWTVEEADLHSDLADLAKLTPAERHLVARLVAFFATGDTIVANNLVLNLYQHVNSPEGRLYLSRQLFEEAVHVQFYLTLLDTYVPDEKERAEAFAAVQNIRPAARPARPRPGLRHGEPAGLHGPAGRPGTVQFLRAPRLRLPGRRHRRRRLRRRLLTCPPRPARRPAPGRRAGAGSSGAGPRDLDSRAGSRVSTGAVLIPLRPDAIEEVLDGGDDLPQRGG
jgi:hypothetical protein